MNRGFQHHPFIVNAWMQGLSRCETWTHLDKQAATYKEHYRAVSGDDQMRCERALQRQEEYIAERIGPRPVAVEAVKSDPIPEG